MSCFARTAEECWRRPGVCSTHPKPGAGQASASAVMYEALKRAERVMAFDLNRMIVMGDDYNQAVRDAYDSVVAARRLYEHAD